jgi:hypothetical protein
VYVRAWLPILAVACAIFLAVPTASARTSLVVRVKSVTVSARMHQTGGPTISKGDYWLNQSRLTNVVPQFGKRKGATVGTDTYKLLFTSETTWRMTGTTTLPGGTIRWLGEGRIQGDAYIGPIRVTGGTGAFAGASGTLTSTTGLSPLNTYRLVLP